MAAVGVRGPAVHQSRAVSFLAWLNVVSGAIGVVHGFGSMLASPTLSHIDLVVGSVGALVAGLGLRRRRNWARLSVIGVSAYAIASFVVSGIYWTGAVRSSHMPVFWFYLGCFALVEVLIILKLCSRGVRLEFGVDE